MAATSQSVSRTFEQLKQHPQLGKYVDPSLPIPAPFTGTGEIKLIVLGQDPTVKNAAVLKDINTVLNLDKKKNLYHYVNKICLALGLSLQENIYATNILKNFFIKPPTQIKEIDIFAAFLPYWLPVLMEELAQYPDIPVVTLGEPLLGMVVNEHGDPKVRSYWGYRPRRKEGDRKPFSYLHPEHNILKRRVYPLPHQPSFYTKRFYYERFDEYVSTVKINPPTLSQ